MKNLSLLLLLFFVQTLLFAQGKDVKTLQEELKAVQKNQGKSSDAYAQKLIELGAAQYAAKDEKSALATLSQAKSIFEEKEKKLPKDYDERAKTIAVVNNGLMAVIFHEWNSYIQNKSYQKAENFLDESGWDRRCANISNAEVLIDFFEVLAADSKSDSDQYMKYWQIAYANIKDNNVLKKLWQFLLEIRKKEFGENGEEYTNTLLGAAFFYERIGDLDKAEELTALLKKETDVETKTSEKVEKAKKDTTTYTLLDEMPRFPGCEKMQGATKEKKSCADQKLLKFIFENIRYPREARENGVEGLVVVTFTVMENGFVKNLVITKSLGSGCDEEVLRIMYLMNELFLRWSPGKLDGIPVRVKYNLPVRFKLS